MTLPGVLGIATIVLLFNYCLAVKFPFTKNEMRFGPGVEEQVFGRKVTDMSSHVDKRAVINTNSGYMIWNIYLMNGKFVIPYEFDDYYGNVSDVARQAILDSIQDIEEHEMLCFKFVERTDELFYISFISIPDGGCWSYVGRLPGFMQPNQINIGAGCEHAGIVTHEILHALGFFHEHQRPDRDDFVIINETNIIPGAESNWEKLLPFQSNPLGVPYDYHSIMHYHGYAGAIDADYPVISLLNGSDTPIPNSDYMTYYDALQLSLLYNCSHPDIFELGCNDKLTRQKCQVLMRKGWHVTNPYYMRKNCKGSARLCDCPKETNSQLQNLCPAPIRLSQFGSSNLDLTAPSIECLQNPNKSKKKKKCSYSCLLGKNCNDRILPPTVPYVADPGP